MFKTSTLAAGILALSSAVALAQNVPLPSGGATNPTDTDGAPRARDIGSPYDSGAQPQYRQYNAPNVAQSPAPTMDNPRQVYITDEYGHKYNSRGDRIR
jgi:hypothetical protein